MITKLRLKNFKSHKDTQLEMRPLTLISGVNNTGKSSILQALLLLRQTYNNNRLNMGLDLNKPIVSLGIGNDVLYKFAKEPVLTIDVSTETNRYEFNFDAGDALDASFIPAIGPQLGDISLAINSLLGNDFQ